MTYQPYDVLSYTLDENEYHGFDTELSVRTIPQVISTKPNSDFRVYPENSSNGSLTKNAAYVSTNQISDLGVVPSRNFFSNFNESLFLDDHLDDNPMQHILEDSANAVSLTITTMDNENNNQSIDFHTSNFTEGESFISEEDKHIFEQLYDEFSLEMIDASIQQRTMVIKSQPPKTIRHRYKSDGKRQIEKSRTKPMVVGLPNLKDIQSDTDSLFWLRLILITNSKNPRDEVYFHLNKLKYHSDDVQELDDQTVCIPLTKTDIIEENKVLSRLSIIKTTLNEYKSELIPYDLSKSNYESQENASKGEISKREAKQVFKKFNLKASRIVCQLLIKQNDLWHYTNIACETNVIEDKHQKNTPKMRLPKKINNKNNKLLHERSMSSAVRSKKKRKNSYRSSFNGFSTIYYR
ncbi:unnamed protein product [Rotaria magnacalcarata]|uniref:Uncharacterized protein n=1 Tax=Rotaria magnacalcarata TaxID=392030 RepID=A0A819Y999_9BILA|nr:unnamed protein product [Rotaria magnacalcarata]CAF3772580.1 unnamed protein product [Rotaria magnacalcarata]CAF4149307.1 unnamed protein product [Rotaria magnacalcarata]